MGDYLYTPRVLGGSISWNTPQASIILRNFIFSGGIHPQVRVSWVYLSAGTVLTRLVIESDGSISYKTISGGETSLILSSTGNFLGDTTKTTGDYYIDISSGNLISIP